MKSQNPAMELGDKAAAATTCSPSTSGPDQSTGIPPPIDANGRSLRSRQSARKSTATSRQSVPKATTASSGSAPPRKSAQTSHHPQQPADISLFDERGAYRSTGRNVCDCLDNSCPGCHFPCEACGSGKCGHVCRANRKWAIEGYQCDGRTGWVRNTNLQPT